MSGPQTLFEKIWSAHVVCVPDDQPPILYIDRHYVHEVTSPQAYDGLRAAKRKVRRPDLTFAVMDHSVPTKDRTLPIIDQDAKAQFEALARAFEKSGNIVSQVMCEASASSLDRAILDAGATESEHRSKNAA